MGATEHAGGRGTLLGFNARRFTFASGYVALVLLGLTLLVGPANLLLGRRRPVSNYLARDVGTWAAVLSVVHVIYGVEVHGGLTISGFLNMLFLDGRPLTNSFGLANWTGLAATLIVVGLLAISSDLALSKLKARTWKNLQRLNYALFALVIVHAFFYGSLLRLESPYTLLLIVSLAAVLAGQTVGVWMWRQRQGRTASTVAEQPG
jgi:sulfoxide reductase heme-binding subunit YedZ